MTPVIAGLALVLLSALTETFAQISLKQSVLPAANGMLWVTVAVALFVLEALIYTEALERLEVSIAFAVGSIGFVTVALVAKWMFREHITPLRWIGIALILCGGGLVALAT